MSQSEAHALIKADTDRQRADWEQVRLQSFFSVVSQTGTKKIKKPSDLLKFPWEEEEKKKKVDAKPLTPEQFNELAQQINTLANGK